MPAERDIVWEYDSTCFSAGIVVQDEFHPQPRAPKPPGGLGWEMVGLCFGDGMLYAAWRRPVLRQPPKEAKKR